MTKSVMTAAFIGAGLLISAIQGAGAAGFTIEGDLDAMRLEANQTPSKDIIAEIAKRFSLGIQNAAGGTAAISGKFNGDLNHILKAILPQHNYAIAYRDGRPSRITFIGGGGGRAATTANAATAVMMGQEANPAEGMLNAFPDGVSAADVGNDPRFTDAEEDAVASSEAEPARQAVPITPDQAPAMTDAGVEAASQEAAATEVAPPAPIGWDPDAPIVADPDEAVGAEAAASPAPSPESPAAMMETAPAAPESPTPSPAGPAAMAETAPAAPGGPVPSVPEATPAPPAAPDQAGDAPPASPG